MTATSLQLSWSETRTAAKVNDTSNLKRAFANLRGRVALWTSKAYTPASAAAATTTAVGCCIGRIHITAVLLRDNLHAAIYFGLTTAIIPHLHNLHPHLNSRPAHLQRAGKHHGNYLMLVRISPVIRI